MLHTLFSTDFRYIVFALVMIVVILMAAGTYDSVMVAKAGRRYTKRIADAGDDGVLSDYTYMDRHGNVYVVTSMCISDNWSLLIEDHGLTTAYIKNNVFLAHVEKVVK